LPEIKAFHNQDCCVFLFWTHYLNGNKRNKEQKEKLVRNISGNANH